MSGLAQTAFDGLRPNRKLLSVTIVLAALHSKASCSIVRTPFFVLTKPVLLTRFWCHPRIPCKQLDEESQHVILVFGPGHPELPCTWARAMETRWVYFGNLNWFRPAGDVEASIRKVFEDVHPALRDKKWAEYVERVEIALFPPTEKVKPRDRAKLHQGFALIRFSECEIAKLAASSFVGIELSDGMALGPLRVALSRAKVRTIFIENGRA
jgi:hypothetical protein